jgi:hypothetical protein
MKASSGINNVVDISQIQENELQRQPKPARQVSQEAAFG